MEMKRCSGCGRTKPLPEFHKDKSRLDGRACWCRHCVSISHGKWYAENRERINAEARVQRAAMPAEERSAKDAAYYAKNRNKIRERARRKHAENPEKARGLHLLKAYGISLANYDAILEAQGGVCAICGMTPEEHGRRLFVDHDHKTGEVRGLLCMDCNTGIARFHDSPIFLAQAIVYLAGTIE